MGITCDHNGWTVPRECRRNVCADPRGVNGAVMLNSGRQNGMATSMDLSNTCASLDEYKFNGNTITPNYSITRRSYADHYMTMQNEQYATVFDTVDSSNMVDGVRARFTCRKGFKPYFNAVNAYNLNNWGPQNGDGFECVCKDGNWMCN